MPGAQLGALSAAGPLRLWLGDLETSCPLLVCRCAELCWEVPRGVHTRALLPPGLPGAQRPPGADLGQLRAPVQALAEEGGASLSRFKEKGLNSTPRGEQSETVAALETALSFHAAVDVLAEPPERRGLQLQGEACQQGGCRPGPVGLLGLAYGSGFISKAVEPVEGSRTQWPGGRP